MSVMFFLILLFCSATIKAAEYTIIQQSNTQLRLGLESLSTDCFNNVVYATCKSGGGSYAYLRAPDLSSAKVLCSVSKEIRAKSELCINRYLLPRLLQSPFNHPYCASILKDRFAESFKNLFVGEQHIFKKIKNENEGEFFYVSDHSDGELILEIEGDPTLIFDCISNLHKDRQRGFLGTLLEQQGNNYLTAIWITWLSDVDTASKYGITPLYRAVRNNNLEMAKLLLENKADINKFNHSGWTPLYSAASRNKLEMVQLLLKNNANVNKAASNGCTPLYQAAYNNNLEMAKLLLENKADVSTADKYGWTALYWAATRNYVSMAHLLLDNKAHIDAPNGIGWTPLYAAVFENRPPMVNLLVNRKANVNKANNKGATPLSLAKDKNKLELVRLLAEKII